MGQCTSKPDNSNKSVNSKEKEVLKIKASNNSEISEISEMEMKSKSNEILEALKDVPLLASMAESSKIKLSFEFKKRKYKKGDDLMKQSEKGNEFFILTKGKCSVIVDESSIAELTKGDYFGETALIKDARRGATIRALINTECLVLGQKAFHKVIKENDIMFAKREAKRMAVSAEMMNKTSSNNASKKGCLYEKSNDVKQWLLSCVSDNMLFSNLNLKQIEFVISQMYKREIKKNEYLIKQGTEGNCFYVLEKGEMNIFINGIGKVETLKPGSCVGELALLYNSPRAASVQCTQSSNCIVWCVDRISFRKALMEVYMRETNKNIEFLKKCPLLQPLLNSELALVDEALDRVCFAENECIFKMGSNGDYFYLVKEGCVKGSAKDGSEFELSVGGFFGERALLKNEVRAATIVAKTKVVCLQMSRDDFTMLLGPLNEIMERNMVEYEKPSNERKPLGHINQMTNEMNLICDLNSFKSIGILGRGAFGTVTLVMDESSGKSYALKAIRKNQIVELGQQSHILNEKSVMKMLKNRFLVNLCKTYKDAYKVYFLLDVCLGGELFTILRKVRSFDEVTAKFYTGCVVEAFDYMHSKDVIYRDLKPENLVLTTNGYLKVTDFGFAKVVSGKTFTLCGTPDYLAPEIVTGQGHGKAVDWWTLGVLMYEMLSSFPPFYDENPMNTYRKIIQGKFKFPRYLSANSKDLVCKFLKTKATKRYGVIQGGVDLIRNHPWFKDFKWDLLRKGEMKPPIRPKVKSAADISNFDHFVERKEDLSYKSQNPDLGWDNDF